MALYNPSSRGRADYLAKAVRVLLTNGKHPDVYKRQEQYKDKFESVAIAEPLLGEVGEDATVINADKEDVYKRQVPGPAQPDGPDLSAA